MALEKPVDFSLAHHRQASCTICIFGVYVMQEMEKPCLAVITEEGFMDTLKLFKNEDIPDVVKFDVLQQLADALYAIHSISIVHQDLKPENFLVTQIARDALGQVTKVEVKIIDFGLARRITTGKDCTYSRLVCDTNGYQAPEVLLNHCYNWSADIFGLGISFTVLLLPRSSLKSSVLWPFLDKLHVAKQNQLSGRTLFDCVIAPMFYNTDITSDNIRVFGGIERGSGKCFLVEVADRTAAKLEPLIKRYIMPGTRIMSDGWPSYANIERIDNGIYIHDVVVHQRHFVDPDDRNIHTENVENMWMRAKRKLRRQFGTSSALFTSYLHEFMFRNRFRNEDMFQTFLHIISENYPL